MPLLSLDLMRLRTDLALLLFHGFDQDGGQAGVVHALSIFAVGFEADDFGDSLADLLGNKLISCLPLPFMS